MLVHLCLGDETTLHSLRDASVGIAITAFHICACYSSLCRCVGGIRRCLVRFVEVADGTAVAHHQIFEAPFIAQNLLQQTGAAATWIIVKTLIGTHHLPHLRILHQSLEGWHVGFPHIAWRHVCQVGSMTGVFGTTMNGIMLGTCPQFPVLCRFRTLQTLHHLCAHHTGQIRVFTISFLTTPPSRVTENVHIGSPDRKAVELLILTPFLNHTFVILCTKLRACRVKHLEEQVRVPRCSHANRLREHRHVALVGSAMQGFAPPEELLDAQSWNGRAFVKHQLGLLFQRQAAAKIFCTFIRTQIWILIRKCLRTCSHCQHTAQQET